jgi:ornithine cyclodeaminase/alanine dehydrogenase-like protein (mu-crystallin family)
LSEHLLYLNGQEVRAICRDLDPIAIIREVFRLHSAGETILPDEAYLGWKTKRNEAVRSLNMPAYVGGSFQAAGAKIINSNPANIGRGIPRASGLTLIFDPETVKIRCMMEGAYISSLRTASVSALSLQELSPQEIRRLTIIGTGVIGQAHLNLAMSAFPALEAVALFDLNREAAEAMAANAKKNTPRENITFHIMQDAKSAVQFSQAIIFTTTVTSGYVPYDWLNPGTVAVNVSLDDLMADAYMKCDYLFVDDWNLVRADARRLLGKLYREGKVAGPRDTPSNQEVRKVDGEIGDLVSGHHSGRKCADDIIIVNPFGLAIEDVAIASRIHAIALEKNMGTQLPA